MIYKLYHGSSQYLSLTAVKRDIAKYTNIKFETLDAETTSSQVIFDTLISQSLFTTQRGIIIKRLYKNKDKDKLIESILDLLKSGSHSDVLFFWEDQKIRTTTKYLKFFKEQSQLEEYDELNKRSFGTWLKKELNDSNLHLDSNQQKLLAEKSNYDPERCTNEIKKIKLDPGNTTLEYTADTLERDIWSLIDAINCHDKPKTMSILENLYAQNNDPNYILSMLARNLRLLTLVQHLDKQHKTFKEMCSILRIPPFTLPSILETSKNYDDKNIIQMYRKLSNLDLQIKTGKIEGQLGLTLICPYL